MEEICCGINSNKLQLCGQYFENYVDSSALKLNFSIPSSVSFSELGKLTVIDHCTSVTSNSAHPAWAEQYLGANTAFSQGHGLALPASNFPPSSRLDYPRKHTDLHNRRTGKEEHTKLFLHGRSN